MISFDSTALFKYIFGMPFDDFLFFNFFRVVIISALSGGLLLISVEISLRFRINSGESISYIRSSWNSCFWKWFSEYSLSFCGSHSFLCRIRLNMEPSSLKNFYKASISRFVVKVFSSSVSRQIFSFLSFLMRDLTDFVMSLYSSFKSWSSFQICVICFLDFSGIIFRSFCKRVFPSFVISRPNCRHILVYAKFQR